MIKAPRVPPLAQWFNLPSHYKISPQSRKRQLVTNESVKETQWYAAYDTNSILVARFRSWTRQAQKPPYKHQIGWEKFTPEGRLIEREVRYDRLTQGSYLH